jgi:hypothetical protein
MLRARRELASHPDRPRARLLVFRIGAGPLRRAAGPSLPYLRSGHPETRGRSLELDRASRVRKNSSIGRLPHLVTQRQYFPISGQ